MGCGDVTFELVPRRPLQGVPFGGMRSVRRGAGSETAGTRPYRPGDDIRRIDRFASARLSAASGRDELVVREPQAEEAARVVVALDTCASMQLYPPDLPWLQKPLASARARELIEASAVRARCPAQVVAADGVGPLLTRLARARSLPAGSFVFVLSDFLVPPEATAWRVALARGWDVVPVVVQDPCWEESFPTVGGALLPVADPTGGRLAYVRLSRREAAERRAAHEARRARLLAAFRGLGLDPVALSAAEPEPILAAFCAWSERRSQPRRAAA